MMCSEAGLVRCRNATYETVSQLLRLLRLHMLRSLLVALPQLQDQLTEEMKVPVVELFEAHQVNYSSPIQYTQPYSLIPEYQRLAASKELQQEARVKELLKTFETCPFLNIRELMTSFVFSKMKHYHDDISNILEEQYMLLPKAREVDEKYQRVLDELRHEQLCIARLINVLGRFCTDSQVILNDINILAMKRLDFDNATFDDLLEKFDYYFGEFKLLNIQYKRNQTAYLELKHYQEWMVKAANEIVRGGKYPYTPVTSMKQMEEKFRQLSEVLTEKIHQLDKERFRLRDKVKFGNVAKEHLGEVNTSTAAFFRMAYGMLMHIGTALNSDSRQLQTSYSSLQEAYKRYLKQYNAYEHLKLLIKLEPEYEKTVKSEQKRLTNHLKKHHQLMVPYETSEMFNQITENLKDTQYKSKLYSKELHDFQQALNFLNTTYPKLFKKVCQAKENKQVKFQIENNANNFRNGLKEGYNIILLQSLARLSHLISND